MRMNTLKILSVCAVLAANVAVPFTSSTPAFARSESIAVVVNDGAISSSDLNDRMTLIIRSSGLQDTQEIRDRVGPQVLSGLIEEELKLQEAARLEVDVSQEEIDQGFATIAKQNNFEADQFRQIMARSGINVNTGVRLCKIKFARR